MHSAWLSRHNDGSIQFWTKLIARLQVDDKRRAGKTSSSFELGRFEDAGDSCCRISQHLIQKLVHSYIGVAICRVFEHNRSGTSRKPR